MLASAIVIALLVTVKNKKSANRRSKQQEEQDKKRVILSKLYTPTWFNLLLIVTRQGKCRLCVLEACGQACKVRPAYLEVQRSVLSGLVVHPAGDPYHDVYLAR